MARKRRPPAPPVPYAPTRKGRAAAAAAARKKRPEVAGPYRSQSSVPSIRSKATPREHRRPPRRSRSSRRGYRALATPRITTSSLTATARRQDREREAAATARRLLRRAGKAIPPNPQTEFEQARYAGIKPDPRLSKKTPPPKVEEFAGPYRAQSANPKIRSKARAGEFGRVRRRQSPYAKAERGFIEHIGEHENLKEPEDLTTAITTVIPGAIGVAQLAKAGLRVGGRALVDEAVSQLAGKGEATVAKGVATATAPKAAARATRNLARRALRKEALRAAPKAEARFNTVLPGTGALKAAAAQTTPVVRGHERALAEHPKTTLETTLHAVPGFVTVPVGMAAQLGLSAGRAASEGLHTAGVPGFKGYSGREVLQPVGEMGQDQLAFAKQVARVITAKDARFVQREVEENLGLMLPLMLGLGTKGAAEKLTKGRVQASVRRLAETVRRHAGREHGEFRGEPPRIFEVSGQRKAEAVRTANARGRIKREVGERAQRVRTEAGRARGEEVVRPGALTKKTLGVRRRAPLKIRTGDLVGFAVRHALPLDKPEAALAEVKRIRGQLRDLPEGVSTPAGTLATRDVLDFIERNPHVLEDRHLAAAVDAYRAQAKHARETPGVSPEHSERARFLSTAVTRGEPLPDEVFPHSIRDVVRSSPERGRPAKDVLRREARGDRARARKLRKKADVREARARAMRAELAVRERAEPGRQVNARVAERVQRMDAQAKTYRDGAKRAEDMAKRKHRAAGEVDPRLNEEFVSRMQDRLRREGKPEPEYVHTGRAREAPTYGATGAKLTQFPGRSKFRKGSAEEYGLVQEGLTPTLRESIARPVSRRESYRAIKGMLEDNEFRVGGKREWTSNEARQLFEDGVISRDRYVLVPRQLYKRAYPPDEWAAHLKTALDADPGIALKSGRHFKIVRRSAAKEFFDQMGTELVSKHLARMNRATSYLILATSPAWAVSQVVAEYGQAAWAQPKLLNPRFVRRAIREYKALPAEKRQAFDSWVGVTQRTLDRQEDISLGGHSGDESIGDAFGVLERTPLGHFIKSIPQSIRALDEWKGGRIRVLTTTAKMDNELNGFLRGTRGLYGELGKAARELRGKPLREQLAYVADHPGFAQRYQTYLDDVMGNWSALTRNERVAAQVVIFYPFIRMSLRWMLYSFPKHHPFRHALGIYLGQANAEHLKQLLGNDPSFFTQWAQFPLHTGGGKTELLNLSRIAPGSNAAIEALGEPTEGTPVGDVALRIMQPVPVAALTAATGLNPLTGKKEPHSFAQAATQLATLSPIARAANEATLGGERKRKEGALPIVGSTERQESLDKLFGKLSEYDTAARYARTLAAPAVPRKVGLEKDLIALRNILGTLEKNSSDKRGELESAWAFKHQGGSRKQISKKLFGMEHVYDVAQNELDGLFRKYKIPYKKAEELGLQRYSEIHYGAKPGGSATTSFGGARIGTPPTTSAPSSGVSSFAGKPAKGVKAEPEKKERFYHPKEEASTFGGRPAR